MIKSWSDVPGCLIDGVPTLVCLEVLFNNLLVALGGIVFLVLLGMFIIGGFNWMTAGDNAEKLKKAKGTFLSAVLGLGIIAGAFVIINLLEATLGIELSIFRININP